MSGMVIVPAHGTSGFVELSRSATGRVFEKHILDYGPLLYPGVKGGRVEIDDDFANHLIENFDNKVCDIVQVPKAGKNNEHTEEPDANIGEVIGLTKRNNKVYARIDARDPSAAEKIANKLFLGASAMMAIDYKNTKTGQMVGPTLLHVAITNRPYVTDLEEFTEVIAASADGRGEAVILTAPTKGRTMDLDEMIATLRSDHNIDVPALQKKAADADKAIELSNKIESELGSTGLLKLSNGETASADDLVSAVTEAGTKIVALSAQVESMVKDSTDKAATLRVEDEIRKGFILPKNKDAQVKLLLSNAELFEELLPEKPLLKLSNSVEDGSGFEVIDGAHEKTVEDEVARLSASPAAAAYISAKK